MEALRWPDRWEAQPRGIGRATRSIVACQNCMTFRETPQHRVVAGYAPSERHWGCRPLIWASGWEWPRPAC